MNYLNISNIIKSTKNLLKSPNQYALYLSSKTAINKLKKKQQLEQLSQQFNQSNTQITDNETNKCNNNGTNNNKVGIRNLKNKLRYKHIPIIPHMVSLRKAKFTNSEQYLDNSNIHRSFLILPPITKSQHITYKRLNKNNSDGNLINNNTNSVSNSCNSNEVLIINSLKYNEIFYRQHYNTLHYDENDIFNNTQQQLNTITQCIQKFINDKDNFNRTDKLEITISNNIKLTLHSLTLTIRNTNDNDNANDNESNTITFPLIYVPIFYAYMIHNYITIDDLLSLIGIIIDINVHNGNAKMNVNEKGIFDFLINKGVPSTNNIAFVHRRNTYTHIQYEWLIDNNIKYDITITYPKVELEMFEQQVIVNCYVDMELLLYMHKLKFVNWDYYVINYLFSFKHFRKIITCTFTKDTDIQLNKAVIDIRNNCVFNAFKYNNKLHVYSFLYTNTNNNNGDINVLYKVIAVNIKVNIISTTSNNSSSSNSNSKLISNIPFTLKQTKKYFELINKVKLPLDFISKFIYIINHSIAVFDYKSFLQFDIDSYAVGDNKRNVHDNIINNNYSSNKNKVYYNEHLDAFTLEICNPIVEVYTVNKGDNDYDLLNFDFSNSLQLNDKICVDIFYKQPYDAWSNNVVEYMNQQQQQTQKLDNMNYIKSNNSILTITTPKGNMKQHCLTPTFSKVENNFFSFGKKNEQRYRKSSEN